MITFAVDEYSRVRWVVAKIWHQIPERRRWDIVYWLNRRWPQRFCWSDLVMAALAWFPNDDPSEQALPLPTGTAPHCKTQCGWGADGHIGKHECECYCGKFRFTAMSGAREEQDV